MKNIKLMYIFKQASLLDKDTVKMSKEASWFKFIKKVIINAEWNDVNLLLV